MSETSFTNPQVVELSKSFVNMIAHRETAHGAREVVIGKDKLKLCNDYYNIPCETHTKAFSSVGKFIEGNFSTPTTFFADPSGKEILKAVGGLGSGELIKKMNEALGKVEGEKIHLAVWAQAKQINTDAEAAFEKGDVKKAIEGWSRIGKFKGARFRVMSQDGLKKADEAGDKALKDALALENVEDKKKALKKIVDDCKGLPVSGEAKRELDALPK
jgi:hypothetical protein